MDSAYGGGGVPGGALGAQVPEQSGVEKRGGLGAELYLAELPRVQRQGRVSVGQCQGGAGEAPGELRGGDGATAFGPGRVGGEKRGIDREPVQEEGATQF